MNDVVELIRQLHNLLKVSNGTRDVDRARLQTLFEKLSGLFKGFSEGLDKVVAAVNDLNDEAREAPDRMSAFFRMKKDQTESVTQALHSLILRFREQEVPFEQDTRPVTEKHLKKIDGHSSCIITAEHVTGVQLIFQESFRWHQILDLRVDNFLRPTSNGDHSERRMSRGAEIDDVEKALQAGTMPTEDVPESLSLKTTEINEESNGPGEKYVLIEVKQRRDELLLLEEAVSSLNSLHEHLNFLVHTQVCSKLHCNL
ncbi:hypothetical protein KIN20_027647 [Parelaphostrongylus tenuis]|uniref:Uncharacterized protein n=1 Tax=Parelaphostrongylus tenuis TaxID=148309 RepID=A0AAD5QZW0_PARTN|nr:hypothetical protein KIN20_027647 [Parelaphostrongylus tenuis]